MSSVETTPIGSSRWSTTIRWVVERSCMSPCRAAQRRLGADHGRERALPPAVLLLTSSLAVIRRGRHRIRLPRRLRRQFLVAPDDDVVDRCATIIWATRRNGVAGEQVTTPACIASATAARSSAVGAGWADVRGHGCPPYLLATSFRRGFAAASAATPTRAEEKPQRIGDGRSGQFVQIADDTARPALASSDRAREVDAGRVDDRVAVHRIDRRFDLGEPLGVVRHDGQHRPEPLGTFGTSRRATDGERPGSTRMPTSASTAASVPGPTAVWPSVTAAPSSTTITAVSISDGPGPTRGADVARITTARSIGLTDRRNRGRDRFARRGERVVYDDDVGAAHRLGKHTERGGRPRRRGRPPAGGAGPRPCTGRQLHRAGACGRAPPLGRARDASPGRRRR